MLAQLESNRPTGLLLAHCCPLKRISMRCHVFDFGGDNITAAQLAVDRQIENCQIPDSSKGLKLGSDRSHVLGTKRWLGSDEFALVPGVGGGGKKSVLVMLHGQTP